jgi:hypothetical protein
MEVDRFYLPHGLGCACWECIGKLQAWIIDARTTDFSEQGDETECLTKRPIAGQSDSF